MVTRATLDGLEPGTQYEVKVAAANDEGSSLPAPEIIFLTYYNNGKFVFLFYVFFHMGQ